MGRASPTCPPISTCTTKIKVWGNYKIFPNIWSITISAPYGGGHPGWTVSNEVDGKSFYIVTRSSEEFSECPVGLTEAYDRDIELDETFLIECHKDEVLNECEDCMKYNVSSNGVTSTYQPIRLGMYERNGVFNGHPMYYLNQSGFETYLYYTKKGNPTIVNDIDDNLSSMTFTGISEDGWTLGDHPDSLVASVRTQNRQDCPQGIAVAFSVAQGTRYEFDNTFSIDCVEKFVDESKNNNAMEMHSNGNRLLTPPLLLAIFFFITASRS